MAVGDRITSATVCGLMRRINALENNYTYSNNSTIGGVDSEYYQLAVGDDYVFYYDLNVGIYRDTVTHSGSTKIINVGTGSGECNQTSQYSGGIAISWNQNAELLFVLDRTGSGNVNIRLQTFDYTGSLQDEWTFTPTVSGDQEVIGNIFLNNYGNIMVGLDNGGCVFRTYAWFTHPDMIYVYYISPTGTQSTILSADPTSTTNGDPIEHRGITDWGSNTFCVSTLEYNETYASNKVYNTSANLLETLTRASYIDFLKPNRANVIQHRSLDGRIFSQNCVFSSSNNFISEMSGVNVGDISPTLHMGPSDKVHLVVRSGTAPNDVTPQFETLSATQTTWYKYPQPGVDTGKTTLGTPDYGLTVPVDNALQLTRSHYFNLRDMRSAAESVIADYTGQVDSGTTDGATTENKLIHSGQNFNTTVTVGDVVLNETDSTQTTVTAIDSDTQLSLATDIMATGEVYSIRTTYTASGAVNNNLFTIVFGAGETTWPSGTVTHGDRARWSHWDEIDQIVTQLEASSLV